MTTDVTHKFTETEFRNNTRPHHEPSPKTVAQGPVVIGAFLGVIAVCVLPVVPVLAHPKVRALVRNLLPGH